MTDPIRTAVRDGIRSLTLDRAPGNPIDNVMMTKLLEIFRISDHDWDTRVIVLESAVPGVFSTGADVDGPPVSLREPFDSFGVPSTGMALVRHAFRAIWDSKWPIIAKVQGTATGDGLLLAALADITVVAESAKVGLVDAKRNVIAGMGILRRCMSEQAARYLLLSARSIEARELRSLGAGMVIVPDDQVDAEVASLAADIAAHDSQFLRHVRIALSELEQGDPLGVHAVEQRYTALVQARLDWRASAPGDRSE
jgi:enoyl-CoA hydratase/carnithine racemase